MIHNIPQPAFEELIAKRLSKSNLVEIRKNHAFVDLKQVKICTYSSLL
jgi:DNA polymerase II small subunit/DNA polymerase delta subunit B